MVYNIIRKQKINKKQIKNRGEYRLIFTVNASLLDAIVLSVVAENDTYGYKITQEVNNIIGISESTLYPVLRRLQKDNDLEAYDMEYLGRNRRYYRITSKGRILLSLYREEWEIYKEKIDKVFEKEFKSEKKKGEHKSVNLGEIIENLKIGEKIENLKIDEKIELLKTEGLKLGKKFDDFITGKTNKTDKTNKTKKSETESESKENKNNKETGENNEGGEQ